MRWTAKMGPGVHRLKKVLDFRSDGKIKRILGNKIFFLAVFCTGGLSHPPDAQDRAAAGLG
jgi:hypothetical protein